jgi:hypothetical protein
MTRKKGIITTDDLIIVAYNKKTFEIADDEDLRKFLIEIVNETYDQITNNKVA